MTGEWHPFRADDRGRQHLFAPLRLTAEATHTASAEISFVKIGDDAPRRAGSKKRWMPTVEMAKSMLFVSVTTPLTAAGGKLRPLIWRPAHEENDR